MPTGNSSPITPLPQNLELVTEFDAIVIRRKWRSPTAYFLAFFSLFWNGFMVVWMTLALSSGAWSMAAFGTLHAVVGVGMAYFTIASFLNRTEIRIDTSFLQVRHTPVPWRGNLRIPVHEVAQLYCQERVHRGKNGVNVTYELHCVDTRNRQRKLLSGLTDAAQARYIETELENILGIVDRRVTGELTK